MKLKYKILKIIVKLSKSNILLLTKYIVILVLILWGLNFLLLLFDKDIRGVFGDMFGAVNSLFSGLAFGGIIITILLQSKELSLQRKELKDTRGEFRMQNNTLTLQRFENTFFKSIELLHAVLINYQETKADVTPFGQYPITLNGKDLFKQHGDKLSIVMGTTDESDIHRFFYDEYKYLNIQFEHYFRNLLNIVESIDRLEIKEGNQFEVIKIKLKYIDILKSNLSQYDFFWTFYYCIVVDSTNKYKQLLEKYSFFSDINLLLIINLDHYRLYDSIAFEKN